MTTYSAVRVAEAAGRVIDAQIADPRQSAEKDTLILRLTMLAHSAVAARNEDGPGAVIHLAPYDFDLIASEWRG